MHGVWGKKMQRGKAKDAWGSKVKMQGNYAQKAIMHARGIDKCFASAVPLPKTLQSPNISIYQLHSCIVINYVNAADK